MNARRIVVGISGASGVPVAIDILHCLKLLPDVRTHLVVTRGAEMTIRQEANLTLEEIYSLADAVHDREDIGAAIASGSFKTEGMVVVPCSMKTLAGIAHGYTDNLLLRAADVTLKEQRRLVLAVRETPFSPVHLRNMLDLSRLGVGIVPLMLTYYSNPRSIEDMSRHMAGKILDLFGIETPGFKRWGEPT